LEDKENSGHGSKKRSKMDKEAGARIRRGVRQVHELALREWEALALEARQKYIEMAVEDAQRVRREKQLPQTPEAGDNAERGLCKRSTC
jgi:hypothetical protein